MSLATTPLIWKTEDNGESAGDSSLNCDTIKGDAHVHNDEGQAIQSSAQIPWQEWDI